MGKCGYTGTLTRSGCPSKVNERTRRKEENIGDSTKWSTTETLLNIQACINFLKYYIESCQTIRKCVLVSFAGSEAPVRGEGIDSNYFAQNVLSSVRKLMRRRNLSCQQDNGSNRHLSKPMNGFRKGKSNCGPIRAQNIIPSKTEWLNYFILFFLQGRVLK